MLLWGINSLLVSTWLYMGYGKKERTSLQNKATKPPQSHQEPHTQILQTYRNTAKEHDNLSTTMEIKFGFHRSHRIIRHILYRHLDIMYSSPLDLQAH